jgi:hypothetical protein
VGEGRTYAKVAEPLTYRGFVEAIRAGRSYVSDGRSHLMNFRVDGAEVGTPTGEVRLDGPGRVRVSLDVAARLPEVPDDDLRSRTLAERPYWDLRRARIGATRDVAVEWVVNGRAVARQTVVADGQLRPLTTELPVDRSSWIAARVFPSSHTNPVFVSVGGKPIRASRQSARWCLDAVNQCWTQKQGQIAAADRDAARNAYDHARAVYRARLSESEPD